jgi:hypothetical protein
MSATPIGASPISSWMVATLDGIVEGTEAVFEAKFILPWSFSEEAAAEKYMAQVRHNMWVTHLRTSVLSIITGGKWVEITIRMDPLHPRLRYFETPEQAVALLDTFPTPDCANNAPFVSM